jgi:hypothetical protein
MVPGPPLAPPDCLLISFKARKGRDAVFTWAEAQIIYRIDGRSEKLHHTGYVTRREYTQVEKDEPFLHLLLISL